MTTKNEQVFQGRIISVNLEQCLLPNGQTTTLEIIHHPGGAAIVTLNDQKQICLVYQYRYASGGWLWELPAGKIDHPESPLNTAQRELTEEAGVQAKTWQPLGIYYSSPGIFDEVIHLFLATDLTPCAQSLEPNEILEVHWVPLSQALEWAISGKINDGKTLIGLFRTAAILNEPLPTNCIYCSPS
jgi:8-oxo-dGTP pyrophosphatase MutT (NUDIX family)